MTSERDFSRDLAAHLEFFEELGVEGVSRASEWRRREDAAAAPPERPQHGTVGQTFRLRGRPNSTADFGETAVASAEAVRSGKSSVDMPTIDETAEKDETLDDIRVALGDCTRCKLHKLGRTQIVFGVGNPNADLMFIGEAPGRDEDIQGFPFVGRAGQLLTKIIEAIGLTREQVYIANVIKCRPPENRNPEPDEVKTCEPFLFRQIDTVRPKVIVALGTFAVKTLLKTDDPISRLRGRIYNYRGAKLVPTFHPAFLLRSPDRKRDTWEDMKKARALLQGEDL